MRPVLISSAAMRLVAVAGRLAAAAPWPPAFFGGVGARLRLFLTVLPFLPTCCHPPSPSESSSSSSVAAPPRLWRESGGAALVEGLALPVFEGGRGRVCAAGSARELDAASCAALKAPKLSEPGGTGTDDRAVGGRGGCGGPRGLTGEGAVPRADRAISWACSGVTEPGGGRRRPAAAGGEREATCDQRGRGLAWLGAGALLLLSAVAEEEEDSRVAAGVGRTRGGEGEAPLSVSSCSLDRLCCCCCSLGR